MAVKNIAKLLGLAIVVLGILLLATRPDQLPSIILILPFILLFLVFFLGIKLLFKGSSRQMSGIMMLFAGLLVMLLALQSLGQLTLRDIVMLTALFVILYFYIYRRAAVTK